MQIAVTIADVASFLARAQQPLVPGDEPRPEIREDRERLGGTDGTGERGKRAESVVPAGSQRRGGGMGGDLGPARRAPMKIGHQPRETRHHRGGDAGAGEQKPAASDPPAIAASAARAQ